MWTMQIWQARAQVEDLPYYFEIRYEDLIQDTESTLKRVCEFVELPWHPEMLRYYEHLGERDAERALGTRTPEMIRMMQERRDRGNSDVGKARERLGKPPQTDRVDVWKHSMTLEDRRIFEGVAGGVLADLGYEVFPVDNASLSEL